MAKTSCVWYLEPLDSFTNEVISREISGLKTGFPDADCYFDSICEDEKRRTIWRCPFRLISFFIRSAEVSHYKFNIWNQQNEGKIRKCAFLQRKKIKTKKEKTAI